MTKAELLTLAKRCEAAPLEQQRELLEEAWEALFPAPAHGRIYSMEFQDWGSKGRRFLAMLDCGAYESAALSMMPEGWFITHLSGPFGNPVAVAHIAKDSDESYTKEGLAATLALAILAAILRAKAEDE